MTGTTQRLFLAVFPPPELQRAAAEVAGRWRAQGARAAWVRTGNLHLTLRFLGDCDAAAEAAVLAAMREAAAVCAPFAAGLAAPGAFPSPQHARVAWLGIDPGGEALTALAAALERALGRRGWPPAAPPFTPHLTLARPREREDWSARLAAGVAPAARWRVERVVLMASTLAPGGARYRERAAVPLTGAAPPEREPHPSGDSGPA